MPSLSARMTLPHSTSGSPAPSASDRRQSTPKSDGDPWERSGTPSSRASSPSPEHECSEDEWDWGSERWPHAPVGPWAPSGSSADESGRTSRASTPHAASRRRLLSPCEQTSFFVVAEPKDITQGGQVASTSHGRWAPSASPTPSSASNAPSVAQTTGTESEGESAVAARLARPGKPCDNAAGGGHWTAVGLGGAAIVLGAGLVLYAHKDDIVPLGLSWWRNTQNHWQAFASQAARPTHWRNAALGAWDGFWNGPPAYLYEGKRRLPCQHVVDVVNWGVWPPAMNALHQRQLELLRAYQGQ